MEEKKPRRIVKPKISFTAIELANQCMMSYRLKYILKNYPETNTLALEIGTLIHHLEELIGKTLLKNEKPNYNELKQYFFEVNRPKKDKYDRDGVIGLNILKDKYFEEYSYPSEKTGLYYKDKLTTFFSNIDKLEIMHTQTDWKVHAVEVPFEFEFEVPYTIANEDGSTEEVILVYPFYGFIDRIDRNAVTGEYRVLDYKTKDSPFRDEDLKTPLQMVVYSLACEKLYGKLPVECVYDMNFLGFEQSGGSKGYMKRGVTKLQKILSAIEDCVSTGKAKPKPSPLCSWCSYSQSNADAIAPYNNMCEYFCLWTRKNPTFEVNKPYTEENEMLRKESKGFSLEDF